MVIYEVNLYLDPDIAGKYTNWLKPHIEEMLGFDGFERAAWYEVEEEGRGRLHWTVHYYVRDREALQAYFDGPAERMRQEGMERFEGRFSAARRILTLRDRFEP